MFFRVRSRSDVTYAVNCLPNLLRGDHSPFLVAIALSKHYETAGSCDLNKAVNSVLLLLDALIPFVKYSLQIF